MEQHAQGCAAFFRAMYEAGALSYNEYDRLARSITETKRVEATLGIMADIGRYKVGRVVDGRD